MIVVHFLKHLNYNSKCSLNETLDEPTPLPKDANGSLMFFITAAVIGSYVIYFSIGGFLHVNENQVVFMTFHIGSSKY